MSKTSDLTIRRGTIADAEAVEAIHWAGLEGAYLGRVPGWPEEPRVIPERISRWRGWLSDPVIDTVVAESHGSLIGFSTLRPYDGSDLDATTYGEMPTLYVPPSHWRLGCGRQLCLETLLLAEERGFFWVVLWVVDVNERAHRFYESFGFRFDGTIRPIEESQAPVTAHRYAIQIASVK